MAHQNISGNSVHKHTHIGGMAAPAGGLYDDVDGAIGSTFERRGKHPGAEGPDSMRLDDTNTAAPLPRQKALSRASCPGKVGGDKACSHFGSVYYWARGYEGQ